MARAVLMRIARNIYSSFHILHVAKSTFEDVRYRLQQLNNLEKHLSRDIDGKEIIILGATALKVEESH